MNSLTIPHFLEKNMFMLSFRRMRWDYKPIPLITLSITIIYILGTFLILGCAGASVKSKNIENYIRFEVGNYFIQGRDLHNTIVQGASSTVFKKNENIVVFVAVGSAYSGDRVTIALVNRETGETKEIKRDFVDKKGLGKYWVENMRISCEGPNRDQDVIEYMVTLNVGGIVRERFFTLSCTK